MIELNHSRILTARPRAGCFLVLFLLAVVTPLRADNPPTYLFQIDWPAYYLAVDSSNNLYATYQGGYQGGVEKFDSRGNYLTQFSTGQFGLINPAFIAVDSGNNVYVADYYDSLVQKFDSNGNYLMQFGSSNGSGSGQFQNPEGI